MKFLGGMDPKHFLENYWEKKPLLIRGALKDTSELASAEDLKELAFDEDFETRIVYNSFKNSSNKDKTSVKIKHGPLEQTDFNGKNWTFIAHNLNLLDENFYKLQEAVSFIPSWLFDDVMATYSKADATIGAHIDKYSVFILQGSGRRTWKLEENPDHEYQEGLDLKILKNFNPNIEWELNSGDMIYIPPSVAHEGVTLEESISYSIGFKSLEDQFILESYINDFLSNYETSDFFYTKELPFLAQSGINSNIIPEELIEKVYLKTRDHLLNRDIFKKWFIAYLSSPKDHIQEGEVLIQEEIENLLGSQNLYKDINTRFSAYKDDDQMILSINKNLFLISLEEFKMIESWFNKSPTKEIQIDTKALTTDSWPLLIDLIKNGTFYFS